MHIVSKKVQKTQKLTSTSVQADTNFDYENGFYPPHINQTIDDDRSRRCDRVQHGWVIWMTCFSGQQKKQEEKI